MRIDEMKRKLINRHEKENSILADRHSIEMQRLMDKHSHQLELAQQKQASELRNYEEGATNSRKDDPIRQAMNYEIYMVCSTILARFNAARESNPDLLWFGMQQAFDAEVYWPEIDSYLDQMVKTRVAVYKAVSESFRSLGVHVGGRCHLAGELQRPVWPDRMTESRFFSARDRFTKLPNEPGGLKKYDLSSKWELSK